MIRSGPHAELEVRAGAILAEVRDDPEGRLALRREFYARHGGTRLIRGGYGRSELDFVAWQVARGLLRAANDPRGPGSACWRATQEAVARDSLVASLIREAGCRPEVDPAVEAWLDYLDAPSAPAWYRAHNASVAAAFRAHRPET